MESSDQSNFDKQSLDALRNDLSKIIELRSELKAEELKQHIAVTGETVLGILACYQEQTLRALIAVGFSLAVLLVAVNAHSSWGIVLACVIGGAVLLEYFGFRLSKKHRKLIEHADLIRSMARGIDNFRRGARQKLLRAYETGASPALALEKSEPDAYRKLQLWGDHLTGAALCPILELGWHIREACDEYGRLGPIYGYLCDQFLTKAPESDYSIFEKEIREMHKACFGEQAHKELLGEENS